MKVVNDFLGIELIPACAIGNELTYHDGSLVIKTFRSGKVRGWRKLETSGEVTNIISEIFTA